MVCHKKITDNYAKSLHYTTAGQRNGVMARFSKEELKTFDEKVSKILPELPRFLRGLPCERRPGKRHQHRSHQEAQIR